MLNSATVSSAPQTAPGSASSARKVLLLAEGRSGDPHFGKTARGVLRYRPEQVVAVLDSRLRTARYGGFLTRSMPALWPTTKPDVVRAALRRLALRSDAPGEE